MRGLQQTPVMGKFILDVEMTDEDDKMRPEYDFTNAVKNPHAAKLRAGTPCRLLECADGARAPVTNTIEWLSDDELATRNRALVETTQRWWPLPAQEREDLLHEVGALAPNACIHGQNKRQCEICGLEARIEELAAELAGVHLAAAGNINRATDALIAARRGEADAMALVLSHEAHIAGLEAANTAWAARCGALKADVDFAARKLMPAHDLLAECLEALGPGWNVIKGKILAWLGRKAE